MKIFFVLIFLLIPNLAHSQIIIGFKGAGGAFDNNAFYELAEKRNLRPIIVSTYSRLTIINLIKDNPNYELYGYSKGAAVVSYMVNMIHNSGLPKPQRITTVGAYHSTNVDFRPYGIRFENYFDSSGAGNKSPGYHIGGVSHSAIMRYVTENHWR